MLLKMAKARHLKPPLLNNQNSISIKHKNMPPTEAAHRLWLNKQLLLHHNYAHFTTTTRSCPIAAAVQHATLYQPNACAQCLHAAHQVDCTPCACEVMPNACWPTTPRWCPMLAAPQPQGTLPHKHEFVLRLKDRGLYCFLATTWRAWLSKSLRAFQPLCANGREMAYPRPFCI